MESFGTVHHMSLVASDRTMHCDILWQIGTIDEGEGSKHLNKWSKPEASNRRRIIEDRQSFYTCKPMVIM